MKTIPISRNLLLKLWQNRSEKSLISSFTTTRSIANASTITKKARTLSKGPDLADFIIANTKTRNHQIIEHPYLKNYYGPKQKVYIDVYGCQMNVNDSEVIWSILQENNYTKTTDIESADVILVVTCSIRDSAEQRIWARLDYYNTFKEKRRKARCQVPVRIGLLGCMAERLKGEILAKNNIVDLVAGPDAYRDLPRLLSLVENHETAINVALSIDETYADITPVRLNPDAVSAFVSIMRGCNNMCTYCIVPFVRGRERSRPVTSILNEVQQLADAGIKEVVLLGQNVNSYRDTSEVSVATASTNMARGFKTVYKTKLGGLRFADLLEKVSALVPEMRIR